MLHRAPRWECLTVLFCLILLIAFNIVYPHFDETFSWLFFTPNIGFFLNTSWGEWIKHSIWWASCTAIFLSLLYIFIHFTFLNNLNNRKKGIFVLLFLIIGPGLIVDWGLKNHWGRARPKSTVTFGGTALYSPPFSPSQQCLRNCSFVSGHAAAGYSCLVFGAFSQKRARWLLSSLSLGFLFGLLRVFQGAHFLSDIIFAFFPLWFTRECMIHLWQWINKFRDKPCNEPALDLQ